MREHPVSRGLRGPNHILLTPPNRYPSRLAGWEQTTVFKLATPRTGSARFGQYLLEIGPGGGTGGPVGEAFEHLVLVLDGEALLDGESLGEGAFAYVPSGDGLTLACPGDGPACRLMWIKRHYERAPGVAVPGRLSGEVETLATITTPSGVLRRELLPPDDPAFDFNVSLMRFPPGVDLGIVEIHDEEHGLFMMSGAGTYTLEGIDHDVREGDFIYMAPYCPQFFRSDGAAEYLLYKDVFRDGF